MTVDAKLSDIEQRAVNAITEAMHAVRNLDEQGAIPANFNEEVVPAIHTLQMFVVMHYLHRINPKVWADWFHQSDSNLTPNV